MGFLIGVFGLVAGSVGFWLDFSADPFASSSSTDLNLGVIGIACAVAGFAIQMRPKRSPHTA
jgi:hypothetical protein